jgi:eukaryotic translation initiation factor 2C
MLSARPNHLENMCLKLNVKLPGGTNVRIDPEMLPCVTEIPTIFMGADVTHPAQEIRSPSIASVVGSMDSFACQYASVARIQPIRAEIILDMGSMVVELLQKFYSMTGTKPQRIIFYRDGISEGQFSEVIRTEVTAIRKACKAMGPDYHPKITFMIVQKRHHTRFFPGQGAVTDPK